MKYKLLFLLSILNSIYCQDGIWLSIATSFNTFEKNSPIENYTNDASLSPKIFLINHYFINDDLLAFTGISYELHILAPNRDELHYKEYELVWLNYIGLEVGMEYKIISDISVGASFFYNNLIGNNLKTLQDNYNLSESNYSGYLLNLSYNFRFFSTESFLRFSYGGSFKHVYNIKNDYSYHTNHNYNFSKLDIYQLKIGLRIF